MSDTPLLANGMPLTILNAGCVCGHDHLTDREEPISLCLECNCMDETPRCRACGAEAVRTAPMPGISGGLDVCSRVCELQLAHIVEGLRRV